MLPLTTVVAVAVSCSVLFIVCSVIGTIVWIRIRQERLSMAVANARTGRYAQGLQNFPAETVTELSPEEGAALGQYGHLPYGNPTEWALIESRERLIKPPLLDDPPDFNEKARSFRNSISRTKSKRASKGGLRRPPRLSSLGETTRESTPVDEKPSFEQPMQQQQQQQQQQYPNDSKDDVSISAVEGVMELPTERSPRQTPDKEPPSRLSVDSGIQALTGPWSVLINREYSSGLFPLREDGPENFDPYQFRVIRGGSIATQSPGTAPDLPVPPPPPCAYPPNRFRMSRNESSTCFSSLSLDTADSSILDDGRRTPMLMDSNFNSPSLPPCPTFAPYSANDVGRSLSMSSKSAMHGSSYAFHTQSLELEAARLERERGSPRRSLTARSTSQNTERVSPPPRRSESVLTNGPKRDSRFASLGHTPVLHPSPNNIPAHWNGVNYNTALLPHFSQMQRHRRQESNDSLFSRADSVVSIPEVNPPGRKQGGFMARETQLSDGVPRGPPPSVLKGGHGPRKGHKRQNCVRISIHPPITFGGPVFSPMAEEPEEHEQGSGDGGGGSSGGSSGTPGASAPNMTSFANISSLAVDRYSGQDMTRPPSYRRVSNTSPPRKRKQHTRAGSGDATNQKTLPGLVTSMPTRNASLSRTPSPDSRSPAVWTVTHTAPSPTMHENSPAHGGQRISAVRGPRSQPRKGRNNNNSSNSSSSSNPIQRVLTENVASPPSSNVPSRKSSSTNKESEKPQAQTQTQPQPSALQRSESSATDKSTTIDREAMEGLEVVSGPQTSQETLVSEAPGVKKTPSTRSDNIVTIWEDQKLERTPAPQTSTEVVELQGDVAFDDIKETSGNDENNNKQQQHNTDNKDNEDNTDKQSQAGVERHKSTGGMKREPSINNLEEIKQPVRAASQRSGKPGEQPITPAKKALGLGIETGTPRSLYDGNGFLKE